MAFFRQLRLLLWKNALSAFRQPLWSLTVLAWPLIVFLILLVTRHQFPPILRETCYVSPRNLPSAGFFPFLQTLMCDTDSKCRNTSSLVDPTDSKTFANTRSSLLQKSAPLVDLLQGSQFFNFPQNEPGMDHTQVALILNRVFGSTFPDSFNNISLGNDNDTFLGNQEILNFSTGSVNAVKKALCTITLPLINSTSPHPLDYAVATFCSSNTSVLEASLLTLNQILTNLMLTKPNETVSAAEAAVSVFDQLQNDTSLWESLLQLPQLFSSSPDQVLNNTEFLLSNLQGAVNAIQNTFPVGNNSLSNIHPLLVVGINAIHYVNNWPGKGVYIPLGQIVPNDSLSVMAKAVLQEVQIPLDKAIGLTLDKNIVHSYLCDNSSNSLLLTAACATGTVSMVLDWISPGMVAQQALLAWSKDVAPHDVSFIKAMLQSLTGGLSPGGQRSSGNARRRRSIDTQPQPVEEKLFLSVGEVVMEILQVVPEVDAVVQRILTTGFQSMKTVTQAFNTVAEIIGNGLKDADQLQLTYVELMTNETQASVWIDRVLDSVTQTLIKTLESESLICEDLLSPFEWLLDTESVTADVWKSVICQNSTLQQALLADWQPLVQEAQDMYNTLTGKEDVNVTLPSILAEWQNLANSRLRILKVFETLITNLNGEYWTNWILDNSTVDVYDTFLQSFGLFVQTFGENIETSKLWPGVKNYVHMAYWILSYTPGVTAPPANCSVNYTLAIHCDTGINWPHFTEVVRAALLSPDQALLNSIEGALNLLQCVYADVYKNLTASFLQQEPPSAFTGNLTRNLDNFFQNISSLSPSKVSNPDIMLSLLHNLLEPTGLSPLLSLLLSNSSVNVSAVLDIASKIYQPIFTSNETDPTMLELEQLIKQLLSLEGNLTLPISHAMGYSLLNYSAYCSLDDVISLINAFTNQSNQTSGLVETILSAIELWKRVMDSPTNDPANIILAYIQQLWELATSLFRLQSIESYASSSGQRTKALINQISGDFINLLYPEMLQNLTDAGPEVALNTVIQMFVEFLPLELQQKVVPLFQDFVSIITECATSQNYSTQVSEIFSFLNQIVELMSPANANVTQGMLGNNTTLGETKFDKAAFMFFSFILFHSDEANMRTANQTLQFIRMIMAQPNISVFEIQNALEQSNLTLEELENITALAQAVNISNLLDGLMEICNATQCFEPQQDSVVTFKCVMELTDAISSFLGQLPGLCNETAMYLNIPLVINSTISDIIQDNSSSNPNLALMDTFNSILANIRMNLQLNQLNTSEIMRDLDAVEDLIQLFASMEEPLNCTSMTDPFDAQKVYLKIVEWYLKRLENITSNSSISELLHPFFCITQMQITLQLAQTDFSSYVSDQYQLLMNSHQYPIDDADVSKIGETVVEGLQHLLDLITFDLEVQNASLPSDLFNTSILNAIELQIKQYLDLMETWLTQPNVSLALTGLLHWRNSSMNVSTQMTDIGLFLKSLNTFGLDDELTYLSVINNITQCLRNALMVAEMPGGLQSDDFLNAVLDAVGYVMAWTGGTEDLPVSTREGILDILRDSLQVIVQPGVSFASPCNVSLLILKTTETIIQYTAPDMFSNYTMYGLKVAITYFESTSTSNVPDDWIEMILNEMKTIQGFLPPNSPAQACISVLINITYSFHKSYPGNMSIWSSFENATQGNVSLNLDQMSNALSNLWPSVMDGPGSFGIKASSSKNFFDLPSVLEMVMTEEADEDTWDNLEEMLESLLSTLDGTELWSNISCAIPNFEIMIGTLVNIEQAQNEMIQSLQMPLLTLMEEVAQSANNTHLNLSDVSDRMQLAIQYMANGTLECVEVLTDWEPVREAAGLSHAALAMWCNISLQPVLDTLASAQTVYSGLNMSNMGAGPVNASDAAARIVIIVRSLYQVSVNQRLVTVQLIRAFSNRLSMLASQPLSPQAQLYCNQQLQGMNFPDSWSSTNFQLPDEVLNMGPFIIPFIRAIGKALDYTLKNYCITQNRSTSDKLLEETAMMFVTSVNTTLDNLLSMLEGNLTGLNESARIDMAWEAVNLLQHWQVFKKDPTIYQTLLEPDSKREILEKAAEILSRLAAIESNMTSDSIFSTILGNWSRLNDTSFNNMTREAVNLLSDHKIFGDEPVVYEALEHFLEANDKGGTLQKLSDLTAWMACNDANITSNFSMIWGNWSGLNKTSFTNMMKETVKLLSDQWVFGDEPMIYEALEQFLLSNDKSVILQTVAEIRLLLASFEANITSYNIFSMIWGNCSGLNETSFTNMTREAVKLLREYEVFGGEPMIYQALEQIVVSSNQSVVLQKVSEFIASLASIEGNCTSNNFSMIWGNWSGLNEITFTKMMKEVVNLLIDYQIFGAEPMIYEALGQFLESSNKSEIFQSATEICTRLASTEANITMDNIFSMIWGNWSRFNETSFTNMMKETVKLLSDQGVFGDEPMIYEALEQFLLSNDKSVISQTVAEIRVLLASFEANITSYNIFSMIWGNWSGLNETSFTNMTREAVKLLREYEVFGGEPMIYQALEQIVVSSNQSVLLQKVSEFTALLASIEGNCTSNNFSMIWDNWTRLTETPFTKMMREVLNLLFDQQIFGAEPMIYEAFEQFLDCNNKSEILQTAAEMCTRLAFTDANITMDNISMFWGNWSGLNDTSFTNMMMEAVKQPIFGVEQSIYQILAQLLTFNRSVLVQKGKEESAWLTSDANITSDIIFSIMWKELSELTGTRFTDMTKKAVKLMSEFQIFGDQPIIYEVLDQFLTSSNTSFMVNTIVELVQAWLPFSEGNSSSDIYSMLWGEFSTRNETRFANMMWEAAKLMRDRQIFGDTPMVYQILGSNDTSYIVQKMAEMSVWWAATEASGLELLTQALPRIYNIVMPLFSVLKQTSVDQQGDLELFEELAENILTMLMRLRSSSDLLQPMDQYQDVYQQESISNYTTLKRRRREAPMISASTREPMDDFIDLFSIDYPAMFQAIAVPPTTEDVMETVHVFFNNPNLNVVLKGASVDIPWGLNASREETVDAALGMLSSLTLPDTSQMPFMSILTNAVDMLPDGFPFSPLLKNITRVLANEYQENLNLTDLIIQTISELAQMNLTDPQFTEQLKMLRSQVCDLERTDTVQVLMSSLSMESGQLCDTFLPSLQILLSSVMMNMTSLTETIVQAVIGDPNAYNIQPTWASVLSETWGFNISSLSDSLNISISPEKVTVGELLRNKAAFVLEVEQRMNFDPAVLSLLMNTPLPNKSVEILSWLVNLRQCGSTADTSDIILQTFCSLSVEQWYTFSLLMARYIDTETVFYKVVLSEELQSMLKVMIVMVQSLADMMKKILPAIGQLQKFMMNMQDLNLMANNEFKQMTRGRRSISSQATFATLSRAMCSNSIKSLFDITKPTTATESTYLTDQNREDLMDRFNIPRNATPFCTNLYLDMVSTTEGAVAWAFLKPMLMGQILFTPDTPVTRSLMEKANATLQEFANLRKNSEDWIKASNYIFESSAQLSSALPMLQNSLANSFVKNFIEMNTDIDVDGMKETLSTFSNMTLMLERNKYMVKQITTLSNLMVDVSSCVTFDRYRGFDSADELNALAQELAKKRDLYASVIFKLPIDQNSSTSRPSRSLSTSSTSSLPPRVSYTIRMHMDNAMRTDRVREPYYVKDTYIVARRHMRYNRGFLYLQESIDRAIIEAQVGQRVTEPAVQLQPFPYPCFQRDEFLQAMSYVFPVMLMMGWVLFVADFVRKLVQERELRLHEYMKMMGVNPLSHFFAWFLDSAAQLLLTTFILTLMLKYGKILPNSDGFLLLLYLCDYGLSTLAFSYMVSSFFDKTYIASLSACLLYVLFFFPYILVIALETNLTLSQKSTLGLFAPTCFGYASQYVSRYEAQGEGIQWSNAYTSPVFGDTASFGWLCWVMLIDSVLYFIIGGYIRMVFPGKYGIPAPWYFLFTASFWSNLCCSAKSERKVGKGLLITNILQRGQYAFDDDKGKGESTLSTQAGEDYSQLPVGVSLHGLSKLYGNRAAIESLNVSFYEGHVTSLLGHNGAGKTTTMSLLTGLFPPSSGTIEVYGRDMQANVDDVRKELGVCMQYDVLFSHLTTKEHLLLYAQIKAPHWSPGELREQVRSILEETGMYAHRHKMVGTLSGGMRRKLSISIAFIGGSRLVVLDEPTTGVDPCSRRSIWDIVIQNKRHRTIIMSTHHLDEAEVLSDRIAFLERGGLKCCGSPFYLKDKLGQGYKLTLTKKPQMENVDSEPIDSAKLKSFVQAHVPEAQLKETQGNDSVYSLPPFTSSTSSSYRSLLTALDSNLDALQLGGYGISDTTLEEVFLQMTREGAEAEGLSISETLSDTASIDSFSSDLSDTGSNVRDRIKLTGSSTVQGLSLAWQQMTAMLIKRFHHSRRDWKGLMAQILLPVVFMMLAMGLGSIRSNLKSFPDLELSPALYNIGPSYSFFRNLNPNSSQLVDTMTSFPGMDNACLDNPDNSVCQKSTNYWTSSGNGSKPFQVCKCTPVEQFCDGDSSRVPHEQIPSSQIVYNVSRYNVERYLLATTNEFIRNRYGGFDFGLPLPSDLQMDLLPVPKNRTLSKVWYNPEGHHTMPAYLNSLSNFILRSNLPADKDPRAYAISVSSHPYFGREDDDDIIMQGMLQILVAVCVLTGFTITTTSFAIYEVKEHHSGSKRLQHIAGISEPFYWTVNFLYDMVVYMIPVTLTLGVIAAFQNPAFTDRLNLAAIALLLVLFGFATFPWMYLLSGVFKDPEMAFITYVCINLFISINTFMSSSILYFLSQLTTRNPQALKVLCDKLSRAFRIFPQFNFGNGLMELARMNIQVQILSGYGIDAYKNPFSTDSLGWMFIASFIEGVVLFTLRLLLNRTLIRRVRNLICGKKAVPLMPTEGEDDEDVAAEHLRVSSGAASADILQVNRLTKVYQHLKRKVFAVKSISVGIPAGECFGLLGVNGAGKTTTFKMLTGDVGPTGGTAQIKDWDGRLVDIMECRNKGISIGYCPQVDALDGLLSGEEHLYFYARIQGVAKKEIAGVVNYLLKRLELNYHRKIISDSYSCGTRRKLSTALALIGHPQILLLDEPSSGMDPRTKRHLWKIISEEVKGKCAVVLTSHSMEECEALCSRLAIMVKGQFRCLGSLQHIKNRFGSGFTVKMYLAKASSDAAAITGFMQRQFPSTYLKDQHSNMVEYHIPSAPGGVADIFDQLESNKNALQIKHFSVSQTTLDEVFINFATEKTDTEDVSIQSEDLDSIKGVEK